MSSKTSWASKTVSLRHSVSLHSDAKPLCLILGRVMMTAPQLFGAILDDASPALELILRTFRAADVDGDWHLSIVEFQTLLAVVTHHQGQILRAA